MEPTWTTAIVTLLLTLAASISIAGGLQNVRVVLPVAVRAGSSATLLCLYDLEGAPLYSVKWYRGRHEFYRYLPGYHPAVKVFNFPGIFVDLSASSARQVTLVDVPSYLSGEFSCEVSADAPLFSTSYVSATLNVVDFPGGRPLVIVEESFLLENRPLIANCTASAPKLDFYVNNMQVDSSMVVDWDGGATMQANVDRRNFSLNGELRLKCVATIGAALKVSSASVVVWWHHEPQNYTTSSAENPPASWQSLIILPVIALLASSSRLV